LVTASTAEVSRKPAESMKPGEASPPRVKAKLTRILPHLLRFAVPSASRLVEN